MRVLLFSGPPSPLGGVAAWTESFLSAAARRGVEVDLVAVGARSVEEMMSHAARAARLPRDTAAILRGMLGPRGASADVLHLCSSGGWSFGRSLALAWLGVRLGRRTVVHLHSAVRTCPPRLLQLARRLAEQPRAALVTPSTGDAQTYPFLRQIGNLVPRWRESWEGRVAGVQKGELRLLYLGWIIREKGLFELVDALRELQGVKLTLFGPQVRRADFLALEGKWEREVGRDRVRYGGLAERAELPRIMAEHDALVLPSKAETFGNVIAEAMGAGLPVIATRVGLLREAPADVFIATECTVGAIKASILSAKRDPALLARTAAAAGRFFEEHLSEDVVMGQWEELYRGLSRN